jgi:hypothetical protein
MLDRRTILTWLGPALALALAACASARTVKQQPTDAGVGRRFQAPYEQTKQAVLTSLTQLKLTPVEREERPDGHTILIGRPPHGFSWGEVGRIFIEKSADKPTIVRVVYEKRITMQFATSNFPRHLFARMDQVLAAQGVTEKSTEVAPATAPGPSAQPDSRSD